MEDTPESRNTALEQKVDSPTHCGMLQTHGLKEGQADSAIFYISPKPQIMLQWEQH